MESGISNSKKIKKPSRASPDWPELVPASSPMGNDPSRAREARPNK